MFDAVTPFADVRKNYFPIEIPGDGWFPVVDELGSALGIWIKPTESGLDSECQLRIETLADADFGATAVLEIEFDRPGYYNGLRLTPFVNMPIHLTKIIADGMFTSNDSPVFQGDALIDRPVSIRFADVNGDPVYVRRLFLTLYQPNYSMEEHFVNPADQLRQDSLARLQSVLPFSDRPVQASLPTRLTGAQYEFGLRNIAGERYNPVQTVQVPGAPMLPKGVFVSGPFTIDGMPEVIRLDADITGDVDCFLVCRPYPPGVDRQYPLPVGGAGPGAHAGCALLVPGFADPARFELRPGRGASGYARRGPGAEFRLQPAEHGHHRFGWQHHRTHTELLDNHRPGAIGRDTP